METQLPRRCELSRSSFSALELWRRARGVVGESVVYKHQPIDRLVLVCFSSESTSVNIFRHVFVKTKQRQRGREFLP